MSHRPCPPLKSQPHIPGSKLAARPPQLPYRGQYIIRPVRKGGGGVVHAREIQPRAPSVHNPVEIKSLICKPVLNWTLNSPCDALLYSRN